MLNRIISANRYLVRARKALVALAAILGAAAFVALGVSMRMEAETSATGRHYKIEGFLLNAIIPLGTGCVSLVALICLSEYIRKGRYRLHDAVIALSFFNLGLALFLELTGFTPGDRLMLFIGTVAQVAVCLRPNLRMPRWAQIGFLALGILGVFLLALGYERGSAFFRMGLHHGFDMGNLVAYLYAAPAVLAIVFEGKRKSEVSEDDFEAIPSNSDEGIAARLIPDDVS